MPLTFKNFYKTTKTFTISREEKSNMSSWWTYSDDAAWLTAGSTDFDEFFWYYGCRLSDTWLETDKVEQSSWWILDITQLWDLTTWDNVMIAFPRRWIKMSKSWSIITLSITSEPNKDWYQYYAHTKGNDDKNTLYLWAYKMVSWYKSLSWVKPLSNSRSSIRSWVKSTYDSSAWTNRYSQITIYPRWFICALYMMKYGNPKSQSVIWKWYIWWSSTVNTWWTNNQTSASYWTSSNTSQIKLFWLEDFRWNIFEWIDGNLYNSSTQLTVDKTNSIYQDSDYATNLWAPANWWIAAIEWTNDGMFKNTSTSWWSSTEYYTDVFDTYKWRAIVAWGKFNGMNDREWIFYFSQAWAADNWEWYGARLMYL